MARPAQGVGRAALSFRASVAGVTCRYADDEATHGVRMKKLLSPAPAGGSTWRPWLQRRHQPQHVARRVVLDLLSACDSRQAEPLRRCTTPALFTSLQPQLANPPPHQGIELLQLEVKIVQLHEPPHDRPHDRPHESRMSVRVQGCWMLAGGMQLQHFDELWQMRRSGDEHEGWRVCAIEPQG